MSEKMPDDLKDYVRFAVKFYKAMHDGNPNDLRGWWQLIKAIESQERFESSLKKNLTLVTTSIYAELKQRAPQLGSQRLPALRDQRLRAVFRGRERAAECTPLGLGLRRRLLAELLLRPALLESGAAIHARSQRLQHPGPKYCKAVRRAQVRRSALLVLGRGWTLDAQRTLRLTSPY